MSVVVVVDTDGGRVERLRVTKHLLAWILFSSVIDV